MRIVLEVPVDADSAFAHRLADRLKRVIKKDSGAIPNENSAAWYEHIVSSDTDGEICAEAFVLLIAPAGRHGEGQDKWDAISSSVRSLLADGDEVRHLERGHSRSYTNHSEDEVVFPSLDETVPKNRTAQKPRRR